MLEQLFAQKQCTTSAYLDKYEIDDSGLVESTVLEGGVPQKSVVTGGNLSWSHDCKTRMIIYDTEQKKSHVPFDVKRENIHEIIRGMNFPSRPRLHAWPLDISSGGTSTRNDWTFRSSSSLESSPDNQNEACMSMRSKQRQLRHASVEILCDHSSIPDHVCCYIGTATFQQQPIMRQISRIFIAYIAPPSFALVRIFP